jgi:hypothetical protein
LEYIYKKAFGALRLIRTGASKENLKTVTFEDRVPSPPPPKNLVTPKIFTFIPVLWIRKFFFWIWIRGSVILKYGSGSRRRIDYGSGRIRILLDIFVATEKKYVVKYVVYTIKFYKLLNFFF